MCSEGYLPLTFYGITGAQRMNHDINRRRWLSACGGLLASSLLPSPLRAGESKRSPSRRPESDLIITEMKVTPIALPDPPLLAASGCHGPYFLRNVIQLKTADGIVGVGETKGGADRTDELNSLREAVVGRSALHWAGLREVCESAAGFAGIELACLDVVGRALNLRLCDLLGGPAREEVEFASYLFFRYAADDPRILDDKRIFDDRGRGDRALDPWGEVRTPEAMAELAWKFHQKWGFTVHKLKGGVLEPDVEMATLKAMNERFNGQHPLRIDPNGRWSVKTSLRIAREIQRNDIPLDYYEDPVAGQEAMAEVRRQTKLPMSTNMCVTSLGHIEQAVQTEPVDIVLADIYSFGGFSACQSLDMMADQLDWSLGQHSNNHCGISMAAMIHLGAVLPRMTYASDTHYVWLPDDADIIEGGKLPISGGKMSVPSQPGVGVELDPDKLARAHEIYQKCGMRQRDDASLMRKMIPGWERTEF